MASDSIQFQSSILSLDGDITWYHHPDWILLDAPQTSDTWLKYRQGRGTGSIVGYIAGHGSNHPMFEDSNPDHQVLYLSGQKEKVFSDQSKKNMLNGQIREPYARDHYCKLYNVISLEVGIIFPTWDTRIGASVDGLVISPDRLTQPVDKYSPAQLIELADGILEIKAPGKMYYPLRNYVKSAMKLPTAEQVIDDPNAYDYYRHIWQTHFDQMQQGMAVLRKPWCDYVVYAPEGVFHQRIPYCHQYYLQQVLAPVQTFLNERLDPILTDGWRHPLPTK